MFLIEGARRRALRRRQEGERSCRSQDQQHGELLSKLNDISAQVQHNTEQISELYQRTEKCGKQVSRHEEQIYALYALDRQARHIRNMINEAFGFISSGCCLVQGAVRKQEHEYEREVHRFFNMEEPDTKGQK